MTARGLYRVFRDCNGFTDGWSQSTLAQALRQPLSMLGITAIASELEPGTRPALVLIATLSEDEAIALRHEAIGLVEQVATRTPAAFRQGCGYRVPATDNKKGYTTCSQNVK